MRDQHDHEHFVQHLVKAVKHFRWVVCLWALAAPVSAQHQTESVSDVVVDGALPYALQLRVYDDGANWLPTLHSFARAQDNGQWLLLAGRTNGLHDLTRGGMMAFPSSAENLDAWVVDPVTRQSWRRSLNDATAQLPSPVVESLASTNTQFYQAADSLFITGGYGHEPQVGYRTFDTLTAIDVPEMIEWVKSGVGQADRHVTQIHDPMFQVTGGAMYQIGDLTHLVFGQNFDGPYNPFREGIYTQQVRTFRIEHNDGLSVTHVSSTEPRPEYRRRDLDVMPSFSSGPNGELQQGLVAFSGVFTQDNGAWTVPVEIDAAGVPTMADPGDPSTFKQGMNGYHSAKLGFYSEALDQMHTVLFGGISLQYYDRELGEMVTDNELPFINQVTTIVRDEKGQFVQYLLPREFPKVTDQTTGKQLLFGANAEFMISPTTPTYANEIIQFDALTQATSLGYLFGGLVADAPNRGETAASNIIFEVILTPWVAGDFDQSGELDLADLEALNVEILGQSNPSKFDLNLDGVVDDLDQRLWVKELRRTYFGDANLDGEFNSGDLVRVFVAGKYETGGTAGWSEGDWNADGQFGSSDLVTAFVDGGYELGPRAGMMAVPEPSALTLAFAGMLLLRWSIWYARRSQRVDMAT